MHHGASTDVVQRCQTCLLRRGEWKWEAPFRFDTLAFRSITWNSLLLLSSLALSSELVPCCFWLTGLRLRCPSQSLCWIFPKHDKVTASTGEEEARAEVGWRKRCEILSLLWSHPSFKEDFLLGSKNKNLPYSSLHNSTLQPTWALFLHKEGKYLSLTHYYCYNTHHYAVRTVEWILCLDR